MKPFQSSGRRFRRRSRICTDTEALTLRLLQPTRALQVNQGVLHPALHRLEQQGWITAKWGESENNRRAKYYSVTPAGRKYLNQERANWDRLSTAIDLVLETP